MATYPEPVQYTEADAIASIRGTAILWEDTGDTLRVPSAASPLPVSLAAGTASVGTTVAPFDEVHAANVVATGAGSTRSIATKPCKYFSIQVVHNGGAVTWTVSLDGSLDGTNFSNIASHTQASGTGTIVRNSTPTPVLHWRYNVTVLGAATDISVHGLVME